MYEILEKQIVPLFYDKREEGIPAGWVEMMKESMATIIPAFSAARMVADYTREGYMPIAAGQ